MWRFIGIEFLNNNHDNTKDFEASTLGDCTLLLPAYLDRKITQRLRNSYVQIVMPKQTRLQ